MTEEQRKDAIMALDTLAELANKCRSVYVPDITALKTRVLEALQSPPIPFIEGLEEAIWRMDGQDMAGDEFGHEIMKAARAYAKLQKGE